MNGVSARRLFAIVKKESLQIVRDPSTLIVAFVLPVALLFLFAFAVSLDVRRVPLGVVLESDSEAAQAMAASFAGSRYFRVTPARDRREVAAQVVAGRLRGYVVIPQDFDRRLRSSDAALVQVVTDGGQPMLANFVANYARAAATATLSERRDGAGAGGIVLQPRFWFNPELESRRALVPGAIAIVMTMIGVLLTALVVAREWERGTMEGLLSTPVTLIELLVGKLLPYFALGMLATAITATLAVTLFGVPMRGSVLTLFVAAAVFMFPALSQGVLISVVARNQFTASQVAMISAFLPTFLLSGFLFEIAAMPAPLRFISYFVPARYFIAILQTVFLVGDVWSLILPQLAAIFALGALLFLAARSRLKKNLER